jgi:mannosyltransferase
LKAGDSADSTTVEAFHFSLFFSRDINSSIEIVTQLIGSVMKTSKGYGLTLLVILLLGLSLRVYDLNKQSIWLDEAYSITLAGSSLPQLVQEAVKDNNPPLYHILLHYWITLFGSSEFSTRFLSVIFGFGALLMIYKVGSLLFDKEVGIVGSFILALSVFHIYYSQEARMYSLLSLLTLLSMYFFIKLLKDPRPTVAAAYILSSSLLMYTHVYGLFIVLAENIYVATLLLSSASGYKLTFGRWIVSQVIVLAMFAPWLTALIKQIRRVQSGFWIPAPSLHSTIEIFYSYSNNSSLLYLFLILCLLSALVWQKTEGNINWKDLFKSIESYQFNVRFADLTSVYLLSLWVVIPHILPFIASKVSTPIYLHRYTIGASLGFYLLVAAGIKNLQNKYVKLGIVGTILLLSLPHLSNYYATVQKEQWRDLVTYIEANAEPGDLLLFNAFFSQLAFDYYSHRTDLTKKPFPATTNVVTDENIKTLGSAIQGYNRVWLISSYGRDSKGLIGKTLSESYELADTDKYYGIDAYLFQKTRLTHTQKSGGVRDSGSIVIGN